MIFNVNIYRTWKKNRILKIKWNKYSIIQFPQCLLKRFPWKCFFVIHLFILLNSASLVRQGASHPPQRNPDSSPHMLFIFIMFYIVISFLQTISCYHIVSPSVLRQYLLSVCSMFTSFDTQVKQIRLSFKGKAIQDLSTHAFMLPKVLGSDFGSEEPSNPLQAVSDFFFNTFILFFFCLRKETVMQSTSVNTNLPALSHINHYFTLKNKKKKKKVRE